MTRQRRYGDDTPFGKWIREQRDLDSRQHAFTANDADWIFHKYKVKVDSVGTRGVQMMMICEVKTRLAVPNPAQLETLWFCHQLLKRQRRLLTLSRGKVSVWSFGCFGLRISGDSPDTSDTILWGRFAANGRMEWSVVESTERLKEILGFTIRPDTFTDIDRSLRRHHKTQELLEEIVMPLGFKVEKKVVRRS